VAHRIAAGRSGEVEEVVWGRVVERCYWLGGAIS
jgi:hypothetical protein